MNDVPQTFKGGTQTFETETRGWGWLFGGGLEAWIKPSFAIYGEAGSAALKGSAIVGKAWALFWPPTLFQSDGR